MGTKNEYIFKQGKVTCTGDISIDEARAYLLRGVEKYGHRLNGVFVDVDKQDPEYVCIAYDLTPQPFDRIRRITGYLVGTLDRFNNGKRAEEHDRVKHGIND